MGTFQVGDVIAGKYKVTHELGKGGMGLVVAARHLGIGEPVALKVLLPALRDDEEVCARFAREARAGMRIKSEHVARVFDVGVTEDGAPFLVMEHLSGTDVARLLRESGPPPVAETVDLLLQACEAIAEAHGLGIVHRDLKPANLFVTTGADGRRLVKVLDFGISKSTTPDDLSVTATRATLGSPLYMSPEQLLSIRSADARSDVWSLGVVLYEMLTGTTPFAGETFLALSNAIVRGTYAKPSERRSVIPGALEDVVRAALAAREARLPSVEAFASRLAPFGTDAARVSCERVQLIAARTPAPLDSPIEAAAADMPMPAGASTRIPAASQATGPGLAASQPRTAPAPRRPGLVLVLFAAGVVGTAVYLWALPRSPVTAATPGPESAVSGHVDTTPPPANAVAPGATVAAVPADATPATTPPRRAPLGPAPNTVYGQRRDGRDASVAADVAAPQPNVDLFDTQH